MKNRFLYCLAVGILTWSVAPTIFAQDRFIIRNAQGNMTPHPEIRNAVLANDGQIYEEVDFPMLNGNFVAAFLTPEAAEALTQQRPDLRIEVDREIQPNAGVAGAWSPDRIDQRVGNDGVYLPPMLDFCENRPFIYVCDTGIMPGHSEFALAGPRINFAGAYVAAGLSAFRTATPWMDPYDHGTAVAGCAVGETTGVGNCPANIVSAVCYPDPGAFPAASFASYAADVIYWAINEHTLRGLDDDPFNDASVLIFASSTVTGPSAILDLAVQQAYLAGMTVVVSAGNQNFDVVNTSPAGATTVSRGDITLTVAASTALDARWAGSNFGGLVELYAPGEQVPCASSTGANACLLRNGTSFSAGYAGGAAARILNENPWATPADVASLLTDMSVTRFGPSGPFGGGALGVPALLFVHPLAVPCVPLPYTRWADECVKLEPELAGADVDCDYDCLPNSMEYFMALDPKTPVSVVDRPFVMGDGEDVIFHFRKADYVCNPDLWEVQFSTDLVTWTNVLKDSIGEDESAECLEVAKWMNATITPNGERIYVRLVLTGL